MPPKTAQFPWDRVKVETLRTICRDLGLPGHNLARGPMTELVRAVENEGLEDVLKMKEAEKQNNRTSKPITKVERKSPPRQTRRTAERGPATTSPRRSARELRQSEKLRALSGSVAPPPKRAAPTRRRKPTARTSNIAAKKSLFDGVMLSRRRSSKVAIEGEGHAAGPSRPSTFAQLADDSSKDMEIELETI